MPDITSPEYLGSLSACGAWRSILRNPYKPGTDQHYRWQVARNAALGKQHSLYGIVSTYDRQIEPRQHFYDTDGRDVA